MTYCYRCGQKLKTESEGVWWCDNCQQKYYSNPKPCIELALFDDQGRILLAKRAQEPMKGKFDLPGGFVDLSENLEEALHREMKEELSLDEEDYSKLVYVRSTYEDYPWGKEVYKNLIITFAAVIKPGVTITAGDDVEEVKWVMPDKIDMSELSLNDIKNSINRAWAILKEQGEIRNA